MVKSQRSSGVCGVGPADKTGKSLVTYCPGGTRPGGAPSRRPLKPREKIGGITPTTLADHPIVSQHPAPPQHPAPSPPPPAGPGGRYRDGPGIADITAERTGAQRSTSATASPAGNTRESWPKVRPAARNQLAPRSQPQPRYPPGRD